jgi:hypothetical protein
MLFSSSGRSGRVSQDPVSDGFAALNEQSQVHPPFKIEINYGKTDKGHKDDRDYGGKAKLVASTRFTSRLRVETSFDKEDDMHCEGKYEAEDSGRECYKNRSTEYDRTQRDQRAGTHTASVRHTHTAAVATAADRASSNCSPRSVLSLPKFSRQVLSAPLFRPVVSTTQMASPSPVPPAGQSSPYTRSNEYNALSDSQTEKGDERERERDKERERDRVRASDDAWMAPRISTGTLNPNSISKSHTSTSITKTQPAGGPYGSTLALDRRDCASDSDILVRWDY